MQTRKIVTLSVMSAVAVVLSIVESFIPLGIPGVKIGLANIVTVTIIFMYSWKEGLIVELLRVLLVGLLYSGILSQAFLLSLSGALISFLFMLILYLTKKFSPVIVSAFGSIGHSIGQIALASIIISSSNTFLYLPLILLIAIPSGIIIGYLSILVLRSFHIDSLKPRIVSLSIFGLLFISALTSFIVIKSYKPDGNKYAIITYQNEEIMKINLNDPLDYTLENGGAFKETHSENGSTYFIFNVYNKDEKDYFDLTVEVKDSKVKISHETCAKHACSRMGYISNKYESIICLPNTFIITIESNETGDTDIIS